jgi:hypothetical protein
LSALLPFLTWAAAALVLDRRSGGESLRRSMLQAAVVTGAFLVLSTEALGAVGRLGRAQVLLLWTVAATAAVIFALRDSGLAYLRARTVELRTRWRSSSAFVRGCSAFLALLFLTLLVIAFAAPPNTWDSMTYHMSRVANWIQNGSLRHYTTGDPRQLFLAPEAEYEILHLQLLSGGDRLANLPQWCAAALSTVAVTLIARALSGDARTQAVAAVFGATLPMGILQATSTQSSYVATFWLAAFVALGLEWSSASRRDPIGAALLGFALGLGLLSKETIFLFAPPFVLWLGWRRGFPRRHRSELAILAACTLVLPLPHLVRNQLDFGSALGPYSKLYTNASFSPAVIASNLLRNAGLHIETQLPPVDRRIQRAIEALHRPLGLQPSDPRTTFGRTQFKISGPSLSEDTSGNPLHLALALAVLALVGVRKVRPTREQTAYAAALGGGLLLFCLLLRWQPWHSRLHLTLFVLAGPLLAVLAQRLVGAAVIRTGVALLAIGALPWVLVGDARPLVGARSVLAVPRSDQYFAGRPELRAPYQWAASTIEELGCRDVGLILGGNDWEYPLWALLASSRTKGLRLRRVLAHEEAADCLVSSDADQLSALEEDSVYESRGEMPPLVVLRRRR